MAPPDCLVTGYFLLYMTTMFTSKGENPLFIFQLTIPLYLEQTHAPSVELPVPSEEPTGWAKLLCERRAYPVQWHGRVLPE